MSSVTDLTVIVSFFNTFIFSVLVQFGLGT